MTLNHRGRSRLRIKALLLLAGLPWLAHADDGPANQAPAATTDQLQEVVVTGVRADLDKALAAKRTADVVEDSIDSAELGRFPDADVADSLEHLPGITLTRTTGGEGEKVSVRGLGPQYNIVTLNNRILATDDDGRDLAFDVLPSEVITGADVLKSPEAAAVEGSIGGTVNLHTASAFDNPGMHGGVHAEGNYNDMSKLRGQKYSAFFSDTNDSNTLGLVLGAVYSDNKIRTDSLNAYNEDIYSLSSWPPDGGAGSTPLSAAPCCITFGSIYDEKKREAVSGSLEWRPSSTLKITADGLYTKLHDPQVGYNESYSFDDGTDQNGNPEWSNVTTKNGVVTSLTANTFQPEMVNNTINRDVDTYMAGLNVSWSPTDRLNFVFDGYRSYASRPEGGQDTFVTAGLVSDSPYAQDLITVTNLNNSLPSLNVSIPPSQLGMTSCPGNTASATNAGYCSYTALMNGGYLNNNKYWSTHYVGLNGYSVTDAVNGFNLDGSYDAHWGVLDQLLFGAGFTSRDKDREDISNDWDNGSGQYGTLYTTYGCPIQCTPYSFASQGFNVVSMISPVNFMEGAGGSYPVVLPALNVSQLMAFLKSLNGKGNPFYCTASPCTSSVPFDFSQTLPEENPYNSYAVKEKTLDFYFEGKFKGTLFNRDWSGNVGVRVVHTSTSASTASAVPVSIWTPSTVGATQTWNVIYGTAQALGADGKYTLALPSLNLSYWLLPQTLQLRMSVAETMSRPDLNQLAPTSSNNAINGQPELDYGGTAGLKPIKANQADISIEWYYMPHDLLSVALFGKKLRDDIYTSVTTSVDLGTLQYVGGQPGTVTGTPFLWTVSAPANGTQSTFTGIEATWQHILDIGFGVRAQVTSTKTRSYDQYGVYAGAINAVPPVTESLSLLYDKGMISADVTWDHQSKYTAYCSECTEVPGWPAISDPFDWVTASLHFRLPHNLEIYFEGKNLSNAVARTYLNGNPLLPWAPGQLVGQSESGTGLGYSAYGRTYVAGASWRF